MTNQKEKELRIKLFLKKSKEYYKDIKTNNFIDRKMKLVIEED